MATKNDKVILELKRQIEEKKKLLNKGTKFSPITNCSLNLNGSRYNIHTMDKQTLLTAIAILKSTQNALKEVLPDEKLSLDGFSSEDWLKDLVAKFHSLNISLERERLKKLEDKLHDLLSTDTKVDLEIKNLMNQI